MQTTLTDALPPKVRRALYLTLSAISLALTAAQAAYGALDEGQPPWLTVAFAVLTVLSAGLGITAATYTAATPKADGDAGLVLDSTALAVAAPTVVGVTYPNAGDSEETTAYPNTAQTVDTQATETGDPA